MYSLHEERGLMGHLFTPRVNKETSLRAYMKLDDDDYDKIERGHPWSAIVTDLMSKRVYEVEGATCGEDRCFCAAVIVREIGEEG